MMMMTTMSKGLAPIDERPSPEDAPMEDVSAGNIVTVEVLVTYANTFPPADEGRDDLTVGSDDSREMILHHEDEKEGKRSPKEKDGLEVIDVLADPAMQNVNETDFLELCGAIREECPEEKEKQMEAGEQEIECLAEPSASVEKVPSDEEPLLSLAPKKNAMAKKKGKSSKAERKKKK